MGIEFISKAAASYTKAIDRERRNLNTDELFRNASVQVTRTIAVPMGPRCTVKVGDELVIERHGGALVLRNGLSEVGRIDSPGAEIAAAIDASAGVARGIVSQVNEISCVAEVRTC